MQQHGKRPSRNDLQRNREIALSRPEMRGIHEHDCGGLVFDDPTGVLYDIPGDTPPPLDFYRTRLLHVHLCPSCLLSPVPTPSVPPVQRASSPASTAPGPSGPTGPGRLATATATSRSLPGGVVALPSGEPGDADQA